MVCVCCFLCCARNYERTSQMHGIFRKTVYLAPLLLLIIVLVHACHAIRGSPFVPKSRYIFQRCPCSSPATPSPVLSMRLVICRGRKKYFLPGKLGANRGLPWQSMALNVDDAGVCFLF
jgi:hypothetical protein